MKIYENHWLFKTHLIPKRFGAFTFPSCIIFRGEVSIVRLFHESVHVRQMKTHGWLRFYWKYTWEFLDKVICWGMSMHDSYMAVSFEVEAFRLTIQFVKDNNLYPKS